jgi:kynureninase
MRPVLTGWFAAFDALEERREGRVTYGEGGAAFAGATYDPTSNYRGAAVFAFHRAQGLTRRFCFTRSTCGQVALLKSTFEAMDVSPEIARVEAMPGDRRGASSPYARPTRAGSRIGCASEASTSTRAAIFFVSAPRRTCATIS